MFSIRGFIRTQKRPLACEVKIHGRKDTAGEEWLVIVPEFGKAIVLCVDDYHDALILKFVDIQGNEQEFMLASVP